MDDFGAAHIGIPKRKVTLEGLSTEPVAEQIADRNKLRRGRVV